MVMEQTKKKKFVPLPLRQEHPDHWKEEASFPCCHRNGTSTLDGWATRRPPSESAFMLQTPFTIHNRLGRRADRLIRVPASREIKWEVFSASTLGPGASPPSSRRLCQAFSPAECGQRGIVNTSGTIVSQRKKLHTLLNKPRAV